MPSPFASANERGYTWYTVVDRHHSRVPATSCSTIRRSEPGERSASAAAIASVLILPNVAVFAGCATRALSRSAERGDEAVERPVLERVQPAPPAAVPLRMPLEVAVPPQPGAARHGRLHPRLLQRVMDD